MQFTSLCTSIVAYVFFGSCSSYAQSPKCSIKNKTMSCSSIDGSYLLEEIIELNITNSYIPSIEPAFFERFPNLNRIVLKNVHLREIKNDSFSSLKALKYLSLGNNNLETFNMSRDSCLEFLDLSDNNLQNLSSFNESRFESLKYFDISNNNIKFLPLTLVDKLKTDPSFRLVLDGNPWNCSLSEWAESLNQELNELFCNRKSTDNCESRNNRFVNFLNERDPNEKVHCPTPICFRQCLVWFCGGIWFGIIIGNVCKLKKLLCGDIRREDKTTQYGNEGYNTFGGII